MEPEQLARAVDAARSIATRLGHHVREAVVVHNSNRVAVRLSPCAVLARVAPLDYQPVDDDLEAVVAWRLAETGSPAAGPDPRAGTRVYARDGFAVTLWTYYHPVPPAAIAPAEYAEALARLHAGFRRVDVKAPHFTDRVAAAQSVLADRDWSPELADTDRELLSTALSRLSSAIIDRGLEEQLLHGEPHAGNVLRTGNGLLFVDFQTCCRGPVEFDIAHGVFGEGDPPSARELCEHYPGADEAVVEQCRILIWAMITTWRWQRDDQLPNGRYWRTEGLNQLRLALDRDRL